MADSIEGFVPIAPMSWEEYETCCFPSAMLRPVELATAETGLLFHRWTSVESPLTGIPFKVRGKWLRGSTKQLAGYDVSMNVPTCSVGNNCLLRNGVPRSCEIAVLLLKSWLLDQGATPAGADALDYERMQLTSVTPTFLHRLASQFHARTARDQYQACVELRNEGKPPKSKGRKKKGFSVGNSDDRTTYLKEREYGVDGYVKDRQNETVAVFATEQDRTAVFDEAECIFRIGPKLNGKWLTDNNLDRPDNWRLYGEEKAYQNAYAVLRKSLRLDEGLRATVPTEVEISRLAKVDQEVVRHHLAGGDARSHPAIAHKATKKAQQQYFSDMKLRVLLKLKVDLSVPWEKQVKAMDGNLGEILRYPGMYVPPPALEMLVFSPARVQQVLYELKSILAQKMPRTLANIALLPDPDAKLITRGKLEVSERARWVLEMYQQSLYQLLDCHELGIFGEVSLDEAVVLKEAALRGEPVTSRFRFGEEVILITTRNETIAGFTATTIVETAKEITERPEINERSGDGAELTVDSIQASAS